MSRRFTAAAGAVPLLLVLACASRPSAEPAAPAARVVLLAADGSAHPVAVELARTDEEHARGLMHRSALAPDAGMLFLFAASEPRAFWMKNTLIPLDMIFIDEGGRVVAILERTEPLTLTPRDPGVPSRYVLEVNGGWCAAHGVRPGDHVRFENVPRY
jgi:uncharacterized membrane protein (UPF0127 family)